MGPGCLHFMFCGVFGVLTLCDTPIHVYNTYIYIYMQLLRMGHESVWTC